MVSGPYSSTSSLVRGRVARFTKLDACGNPVYTKGTYTTEAFIQVIPTKNIDAGDEIKVRFANGLIGVHEPGQISMPNFGIQIDLAKVNPGVVAALTADVAVLDYAGSIVGWEELELVAMGFNFALEVWTASSGPRCSAGSLVSGYMLYPLIGQGYVDLDPVTDKEINISIKAQSYANPNWGRGPYGTGTVATRTVADATTTIATPNLGSASAAFTAADIGKLITSPNFPAGSWIQSITSATVAVINTNASATGAAQALTIGVNDGSSLSGPVAVSSGPAPGRLLVSAAQFGHRHFEVTPIPAPAPSPADGMQTFVGPTVY